MSFWNLLLIGGVITWTACVFLRAVATRTCQLRAEMLPLPDEDVPIVLTGDETLTVGPSGPSAVAEVLSRPLPPKNGNGKAPTNGNGNGNGHAKVPLKRPGR